MIALTDTTFEAEVLKSALPVLVDFWASWCPPCRAAAPVMARLAVAFAGRVHVMKLDVDVATETAKRYRIQSIPAFRVFKNGRVVHRVDGFDAQLKAELTEALEKAAR